MCRAGWCAWCSYFMFVGWHFHTFPMSVVLQCRINLGITETPVHFGAVETVAVLGKDYALYLDLMPVVVELKYHPQPLQVDDKHIPVTAPADFRFEDVVKLILRLVRLFQAVALDVLFPVCHMQPVLLR